MKKIIALLFAAILMVSAVGTGLAGGDPATCKHLNCGWKTITPATCTTSGTDWYYCKDCGKDLYFRTTPKKDHVPQTKTVAPKCTVDGYQVTTCKNCGTTLNLVVTTPKLGHKWNLVGQSHNIPKHQWHWKCGRCGKTVTTALNSTSPNPSPVRPAIY